MVLWCPWWKKQPAYDGTDRRGVSEPETAVIAVNALQLSHLASENLSIFLVFCSATRQLPHENKRKCRPPKCTTFPPQSIQIWHFVRLLGFLYVV
jgi:hypothetical protein